MNKQELAKCVARRSRQSAAAIADRLDSLVYQLWKDGLKNARAKKESNPGQKDHAGSPLAPLKEL